MKRHMPMLIGSAVVIMIAMVTLGGVTFAEEAGCLQTKDNWIIRVYSERAASPYSIILAVIDPKTGGLVSHNDIKAFAGTATPCLNTDRTTTHVCEFEAVAENPDMSLGCDSAAGTAYIVHDHVGQLTISTIPEIVKYIATSPMLSATPSSLAFGKVVKSKTLSVSITNTGTSDLHISSVTAPATPYSIASDTCTGATVAPASGSCSISIKFSPNARGSYTDSFNIYSDGGNVTIQLMGSN